MQCNVERVAKTSFEQPVVFAKKLHRFAKR